MNIVNPLEPELNVSFNVNQHAVERLKARCEQAAERLELVMLKMRVPKLFIKSLYKQYPRINPGQNLLPPGRERGGE